MRKHLTLVSMAALVAVLAGGAWAATPLAEFTVKDYLDRTWTDELVHFDFDVKTTAKDLTLTDPTGAPAPCQFSDVVREGGRVRGKVWTVVTLGPHSGLRFGLAPGKPPTVSGVTVKKEKDRVVLSGDRCAVALAQWPAKLAKPVKLTELSAPVLGVSRTALGPWLGNGAWFVAGGETPEVKAASTEIVEAGPVRATVRERLVFSTGQTYTATVSLGVAQEAALISEETDLEAPQAAWRFTLKPGLQADQVYWCSNYWREANKGTKPTPLAFDKDNVICKLYPWSFWWLPDISGWAGFYHEGAEPLVGVIMLRPSRWSPVGWSGFDRTAIPVTARPDGHVDMTMGMLAWTNKDAEGKETREPLRRQWAILVGTTTEHLREDPAQARLRQQLIKHSEFPLDEVKDYGFEFTPGKQRISPWILYTQQDIERVRRLVDTVPVFKAQIQANKNYILNACNSQRTLEQEGWEAYYDKNYVANGQGEKVPQYYIGTGEKVAGDFMAAVVKGLTRDLLRMFLEKPEKPMLGRYGPWYSEYPLKLMLNYDLIAGSGLLKPEEEALVRNVLVFSAHLLAHPDYWNTNVGLCSANPNMTSSIVLPVGMVGLYLDGHPKSQEWLKESEEELKRELKDWISPGGAWVENPGYQSASLDGMFLLAQAIKNVTGRDYFADPQLKATMDYYGFLLTPPDPFYPIGSDGTFPHPGVLPAIGDMMTGYITPWHGWMAAETAKTDPEFAALMQFYWQRQGSYVGSGEKWAPGDVSGRAKGFTLAMVDPEIKPRVPEELSRAFPGFGSIMRTSWTDPKATYLAHRAGENIHHYHYEQNSLVFYAKGAPLCLDWGIDNGSKAQMGRMDQPWLHNMLSFDKPGDPIRFGPTYGSGKMPDFRPLRRTVDYSWGQTAGSGNQRHDRHLLLVKSADPLGANYVVVRDATQDGQPNQQFWWNLWCNSSAVQVEGKNAHFTGQWGVDLDVHLLSPAAAVLEQDHVNLDGDYLYVWGPAKVEQYGLHVQKAGSAEDYLAVLYPRAPGQEAAQASSLAGGAGLAIKHMEGEDLVLLSPGKAAEVTAGGVTLAGEVAFARKYTDGKLRLAVVAGKAAAAAGGWSLSSESPTAVEIAGAVVSGESSGAAHQALLTVPPDWTAVEVLVDGKVAAATLNGRALSLELPAGYHTFEVRKK